MTVFLGAGITSLLGLPKLFAILRDWFPSKDASPDTTSEYEKSRPVVKQPDDKLSTSNNSASTPIVYGDDQSLEMNISNWLVVRFLTSILRALSHPTAVIAIIAGLTTIFTTVYKDRAQARILELTRLELKTAEEENQRRQQMVFAAKLAHAFNNQKKAIERLRYVHPNLELQPGEQRLTDESNEKILDTCRNQTGTLFLSDLIGAITMVIDQDATVTFMLEASEEDALILSDYVVIAKSELTVLQQHLKHLESSGDDVEECTFPAALFANYIHSLQFDHFSQIVVEAIEMLE